jgi:hypothetical protein
MRLAIGRRIAMRATIVIEPAAAAIETVGTVTAIAAAATATVGTVTAIAMSGATDRAIRVATGDRAGRTAAIPRRVAPRAPHSRNAAAVDNEPRHRVRT